jgi:hypothetical protein
MKVQMKQTHQMKIIKIKIIQIIIIKIKIKLNMNQKVIEMKLIRIL